MNKPLNHNMDELRVFDTLRSPQQLRVFDTLRSPQQFHFKHKNIIDLL